MKNMKLLSLNIWTGRQYRQLSEFLKKYSKEIDIFCLSEVFHNGKLPEGYHSEENMEIFSDLKKWLPNFNAYLAPLDSTEESLAIFTKKDIVIDNIDYFFALKQPNGNARKLGIPLQYMEFKSNGKQYTICNFHGWWVSNSKSDTPERLEQSKKVKEFLDNINGPKIICGDFNLAPETESIRIIDRGMRNLIKENKITSTRSHLYTKEVKFADYMIVSSEIEVKKFEVLQDVVSDHLPLYLDFN